jgi:hypothetical protein
MNDAEHDFWLSYFRLVADSLDLRDWHIVLNRQPPSDLELMAQSQIVYGRRSVVMWLSSHFLAQSPQDQRQAVIHELLHAHFYPIQAVVHQAFDDDDERTFCRLHHLYFEQTVDSVATAVASLLPLPETP